MKGNFSANVFIKVHWINGLNVSGNLDDISENALTLKGHKCLKILNRNEKQLC